MNNLDAELKRALTRHEPSTDFTARVLDAVAQPGRLAQIDPLWPRISRVLFGRWAAATATTLIISGGVVYQQHERGLQGEAAKRKLIWALQVAGEKLHDTQQVLAGGTR